MMGWGWLAVGAVLFWLLKGPSITIGSGKTVPQLPGAAGIVQTLGVMRGYVNDAIDHPVIRQHAARATEHVPRGNHKEMAVSIGEWVRAHVRYFPDPLRKENVTRPEIMAVAVNEGKKVYGDCDDMSMYVAALAKAAGLQPTFHAVGRQDRFHHVYTEVAGVPIDPTVQLGVQPFNPRSRISLQV